MTPAERCGIGVKGNRWETMLLNSLKVPQIRQHLKAERLYTLLRKN